MANVRVKYIGGSEVLVGHQFVLPQETIEINEKLLPALRAMHGDVFIAQGADGAPQAAAAEEAAAAADVTEVISTKKSRK